MSAGPRISPNNRNLSEIGGFKDSGFRYYAHGARTYLALDGTPLGGISLCEKEGYHNGRFVKTKIALLAAMAAATGRTLLLPRVLVDYHTYFLWTFLDLSSLGVGVDFRETNFLHNPRARASPDRPMDSVARVALGRGAVAGAVGADGAGPVWAALDPNQDVVDHWAAALEPHAAAELLLVNLDFVDGEFVAVLTNCAPDARKQCLRRVGVPPEFLDFFQRLRWCGETVDLNKMATKSFQGFDCFAKGEPHKMVK